MFSQGIRKQKLQHGLIFVARVENSYCEEASERL